MKPTAWLRRQLIAAGIAPRLPWHDIVLACLFRTRPLTSLGGWRRQFVRLFPHVDVRRPGIADLVRIPLQLLWVCLVRTPPPTPARDARSPGVSSLDAVRSGLRRAAALLLPLRRRLPGCERVAAAAEQCARLGLWDKPAARRAGWAVASLLALLCVTTPFDTLAQLAFVVTLCATAMLIRRVPGPLATLFLIVLSAIASTRYLWWRVAYTLNCDAPLDAMWGALLLGAEIYTWLILMLGYLQTAWPLRRRPVPLPADARTWPTVDVFITTYNEPLEVAMPTVLAAAGIDWPRDKLKVYLLDDGRRDEFRRFAEEAGVGYLVRSSNEHAKAGNLNHALTATNGEYIAVFDCDHIPTRSFLQTTMGWFVHDHKLALLQTPHHFFSADPFERNLGLFRRMPNEGELFYGVVQDGNDLWNATFFCGSCAVLRRAPLIEIGGIAVETVTEDAHTALKLQRHGYRSAYFTLPQAAGMATESLSAHVGQRMRWAKGMAQIFRLDNPFLGKGLTWMQRICYGNAMLHFFNGGPRLVFLTAPLAFLLFHAHVIYAPAISVILYVLPHMVHANLTNSRIQSDHRHSFWADVYETVLAWYIVRPTMQALLAPHKGRFNVTPKGGLVERDYFDWSIARPYLLLTLLNLLGLAMGICRIAWGPADEIATALLNLAWTSYNILLLGGAIAVAAETRQVRRAHRVAMHLPAVLYLPDGHLLRCETDDFSDGGAVLRLPDQARPLQPQTLVQVALWRGHAEYAFPARVVGQGGRKLRLRWELESNEQRMQLVQCTFARADAWVSWAHGRRADRPLRGLRNVLVTGAAGYRRAVVHALQHDTPLAPRLIRAWHWSASLLPRHPLPIRGRT
jgi:cellulose synthase (UDP-forming)